MSFLIETLIYIVMDQKCFWHHNNLHINKKLSSLKEDYLVCKVFILDTVANSQQYKSDSSIAVRNISNLKLEINFKTFLNNNMNYLK